MLCGTTWAGENPAEDASAEFAEGVRLREDAARARPHFRQAAQSLEKLRAQGIHNRLLYRDLGNCYLLAGDLPRAILSYQRGLRLAPFDRDLLARLAKARQMVVYPSGTSLGRIPPEQRPPWLPRLRPQWLFVAAVLLYAVACVFLTRWLMVRQDRLLFIAAGAFVGAVAFKVGLVFLGWRQQEEVSRPLVVIAEDGVLLRKGNNLNFPPRYETPVNKGVEARLLFQRGDWLQIELAGHEAGWVPRSLVLLEGADSSS